MDSNLFVLLHIVPDFFKGVIKQTGGSMSGVGLVILEAHSHVLDVYSLWGSAYLCLFSFKRVKNAPNFLSPLKRHGTV